MHLNLFHSKGISRFGMEVVSRLEHGRREVRVVDRIRIDLRLKAERMTEADLSSALALALGQEVRAVDLHARERRGRGHLDAGLLAVEHSSGVSTRSSGGSATASSTIITKYCIFFIVYYE